MALIRSAYRGPASRAGWTSEADLVAGNRTDLEQVLGELADPAARMVVAQRGDRLLGCCRVLDIGARRARLGTFAVDPEQQGGGIGRRLLEAAVATAGAQLGAATIEITVLAPQTELLAWYERLGFAPTGETRPFPTDPEHAQALRGGLEFVVLTRPVRASPAPDG